jgi:phosphoglycerate dehydrogenase-like enzyme
MNVAMERPLRILLSQQAMMPLEGAIAPVMGARPFELVSIESAVASARSDIDIAFITRDVTGLSTKHVLADALQACYAVLRRSDALKWVHIHSAGADRPVYVELRERGVTVTSSSGANAEVVAATALAGLLALARRFPQLMAAQRTHSWAPLLAGELPRDLAGQTVVLVGWGPIGQRIGALLRLLGMKLVVVRNQSTPAQDGAEMVTFDDFTQILPRADWLLLACPLTDKTRRLVDAQALAKLPRGAGLINVARGEVVVEPGVIAALQSGQLGSAFLDVFAHEPLAADSPLWDLPNVIVTPHSAGHSDGNYQRVIDLFLDNLRRWCAGEPLVNAIK